MDFFRAVWFSRLPDSQEGGPRGRADGPGSRQTRCVRQAPAALRPSGTQPRPRWRTRGTVVSRSWAWGLAAFRRVLLGLTRCGSWPPVGFRFPRVSHSGTSGYLGRRCPHPRWQRPGVRGRRQAHEQPQHVRCGRSTSHPLTPLARASDVPNPESAGPG